MRLITIDKTYEGLRVSEGASDGSRIEWTATGALSIHLKGAFAPMEYEQAANLALNIALGMNIPAISFRRVMKPSAKKNVKRHDKAQRLF